MTEFVQHLDTPFGRFTLCERDGAVVASGWRGMEGRTGSPLLEQAVSQLEAYFSGDLTEFVIPVRVDAPEIVRDVCAALQRIPFGETRTYGDLARELGRPAQAIGQACGRNPIPVIIPCHRVLGAKGLGGFSAPGGVETKVALLKLEGAAGLLI